MSEWDSWDDVGFDASTTFSLITKDHDPVALANKVVDIVNSQDPLAQGLFRKDNTGGGLGDDDDDDDEEEKEVRAQQMKELFDPMNNNNSDSTDTPGETTTTSTPTNPGGDEVLKAREELQRLVTLDVGKLTSNNSSTTTTTTTTDSPQTTAATTPQPTTIKQSLTEKVITQAIAATHGNLSVLELQAIDTVCKSAATTKNQIIAPTTYKFGSTGSFGYRTPGGYIIASRQELLSTIRSLVINISGMCYLTDPESESLLRVYQFELDKLQRDWLRDNRKVRGLTGVWRGNETHCFTFGLGCYSSFLTTSDYVLSNSFHLQDNDDVEQTTTPNTNTTTTKPAMFSWDRLLHEFQRYYAFQYFSKNYRQQQQQRKSSATKPLLKMQQQHTQPKDLKTALFLASQEGEQHQHDPEQENNIIIPQPQDFEQSVLLDRQSTSLVNELRGSYHFMEEKRDTQSEARNTLTFQHNTNNNNNSYNNNLSFHHNTNEHSFHDYDRNSMTNMSRLSFSKLDFSYRDLLYSLLKDEMKSALFLLLHTFHFPQQIDLNQEHQRLQKAFIQYSDVVGTQDDGEDEERKQKTPHATNQKNIFHSFGETQNIELQEQLHGIRQVLQQQDKLCSHSGIANSIDCCSSNAHNNNHNNHNHHIAHDHTIQTTSDLPPLTTSFYMLYYNSFHYSATKLANATTATTPTSPSTKNSSKSGEKALTIIHPAPQTITTPDGLTPHDIQALKITGNMWLKHVVCYVDYIIHTMFKYQTESLTQQRNNNNVSSTWNNNNNNNNNNNTQSSFQSQNIIFNHLYNPEYFQYFCSKMSPVHYIFSFLQQQQYFQQQREIAQLLTTYQHMLGIESSGGGDGADDMAALMAMDANTNKNNNNNHNNNNNNSQNFGLGGSVNDEDDFAAYQEYDQYRVLMDDDTIQLWNDIFVDQSEVAQVSPFLFNLPHHSILNAQFFVKKSDYRLINLILQRQGLEKHLSPEIEPDDGSGGDDLDMAKLMEIDAGGSGAVDPHAWLEGDNGLGDDGEEEDEDEIIQLLKKTDYYAKYIQYYRYRISLLPPHQQVSLFRAIKNSKSNTHSDNIADIIDVTNHIMLSFYQPEIYVKCSSTYCNIVRLDYAHALSCGHYFCEDCWVSGLTSTMDTKKREAITIRCLGGEYEPEDDKYNKTDYHTKLKTLIDYQQAIEAQNNFQNIPHLDVGKLQEEYARISLQRQFDKERGTKKEKDLAKKNELAPHPHYYDQYALKQKCNTILPMAFLYKIITKCLSKQSNIPQRLSHHLEMHNAYQAVAASNDKYVQQYNHYIQQQQEQRLALKKQASSYHKQQQQQQRLSAANNHTNNTNNDGAVLITTSPVGGTTSIIASVPLEHTPHITTNHPEKPFSLTQLPDDNNRQSASFFTTTADPNTRTSSHHAPNPFQTPTLTQQDTTPATAMTTPELLLPSTLRPMMSTHKKKVNTVDRLHTSLLTQQVSLNHTGSSHLTPQNLTPQSSQQLSQPATTQQNSQQQHGLDTVVEKSTPGSSSLDGTSADADVIIPYQPQLVLHQSVLQTTTSSTASSGKQQPTALQRSLFLAHNSNKKQTSNTGSSSSSTTTALTTTQISTAPTTMTDAEKNAQFSLQATQQLAPSPFEQTAMVYDITTYKPSYAPTIHYNKLLWWTLDLYVAKTKNIKWCASPRCDSSKIYSLTQSDEKEDNTTRGEDDGGGNGDEDYRPDYLRAHQETKPTDAHEISEQTPFAIIATTSCTSYNVECRCHHQQCFKCGEAQHSPVPCDLIKTWLSKMSGDAATDLYIKSHAKPCPQCKIAILKDKACAHMTCSQCRHEFCWLCLGPWRDHKGYYECKHYTAGAKAGKLLDAEQAFRDNVVKQSKYEYYFERWHNHQLALEHCQYLKKAVTQHFQHASAAVLVTIIRLAGESGAATWKAPPTETWKAPDKTKKSTADGDMGLQIKSKRGVIAVEAAQRTKSINLFNLDSVDMLKQFGVDLVDPNMSYYKAYLMDATLVHYQTAAEKRAFFPEPKFGQKAPTWSLVEMKAAHPDLVRVSGGATASLSALLNRFDFIQQALDVLIECRHTLAHSYVVCYFFKTQNTNAMGKATKAKKQLFELQLSYLLQPTEDLQSKFDRIGDNLVYIFANRKIILDQIALMKKLQHSLINMVEIGTFDDSLLHDADVEMSSDIWLCVCPKELSNAINVCPECRACKIHREPECIPCSRGLH